jgi:hemoglobin-like flavoprotein
MKEALFSTFQQEAGGIVFTEKVQEAWTYVWDTMTVAMAQALEDEGSTLTLVMDSWEMITEHKTSRDLGELLYDYLFTLVPNVRHMFTKSREEMAITMGEALEMIISCAEVKQIAPNEMFCWHVLLACFVGMFCWHCLFGNVLFMSEALARRASGSL